jgi:hypothetical protein
MKLKYLTAVLAVLTTFTAFPPSTPAISADPLAENFVTPPEAAKPWVYYFVMDGNLTREGITADFESLKRAGIGGILFMEVNVGIPRGTVQFMSPEWRQLFKHAVAETERLGLQMTLNAGPGWTGSGGPWIKPEQSMQHVVASAVEVTGPKRFNEILPRPQRWPAYFGDGHLPPDLEKVKNDFYLDISVLAFPTPTGEQRIAAIDEKALYVRAPYSSRPGVKAALPSQANHPVLPNGTVIPANRIVDLTTRMTRDGELTWDIPEGKWTILRFGRTSTGTTTRPAPVPGLGLESDKLDKAALDAHFDAFIGTLLREIGPRRKSNESGWNMLHIDSWEMGAQNWSENFRKEFKRRRGYDLMRYLPTVTGRVVDSLEVSERFLWDLRQTAQELVIENHAQHLKTLGKKHGFGLSIEPYDMNPCADMSLGAVADVPMCEFWLYGFKTHFCVIEAASIAHTVGRPIVAAEAFTSNAEERWQAYPASMKTLGDWAFCAGVNRIVFHRYQHQPWLDRWPGMTFGPYGVHWDRTQTWWDMVPAYHTYLARCQYLLRQGLSVADICYLVAEGSPQVFRPPPSATVGYPPGRPGYNFDGCAPETLLARMTVKDGRLVLPDGMSYRALVLPERDTMTPALLKKIHALVKAGATVVGPRPLKSPSLVGYPQCDIEVKKLADELWGNCDGKITKEHTLGKGKVIWEQSQTTRSDQEPKDPLAQAQWIWHAEGKPAIKAPVGKRYFHRVITLDDKVESAQAYMTADNSFELFINGQRAGKGDNFHEICMFDVTSLLQAGPNVLAVLAENGGDTPNAAGLIGSLIIKYRDGHTLEIRTDKQWQSVLVAEGNWATASTPTGTWKTTLELGPANMSPWKLKPRPAAEPEQYGDYAIVANVLSKAGIPLDFESDGPLLYTHRRIGHSDIYFVANRENRRLDATCTFRVIGKTPELWNAVTGDRHALPEFTTQEHRTTLPMRFDPTQSFFIIFRDPAITVSKPGHNFANFIPTTELSGSWDVSFDPKWGGPQKVTFQALDDWSKRSEEGIKYYSGTATYRQKFKLSSIPQNRSVLDLGKVQVMAQVKLNGKDLGTLWTPPYRVEINDAALVGENTLEIRVANLWPNRLIGDQAQPVEKRLAWTTWNPFKNNSPLLESGLLGPVQIMSASEK